MGKKQQTAIKALLGIIFVDYAGVGIVFVIAPALFLTHNSIISAIHPKPHLLKLFFCLFLAAYPLGQFYGARFFGKLSDRLGRKKVLLVTLACTFCGYLILVIGILAKSVFLLIAGRLFSGLCAGNVAVAQAGIIDYSSENTKAQNMSLMQSIIGLAWIIGTPLGGLLYARFSDHLLKFTTPLLLVAALLILLYLYTCFFLKEMHTETKPSTDPNQILKQQAVENKNPIQPIRSLLLVWFFLVFAQWVFEALMPGYFVERFTYSPTHIGLILGVMGLTYMLSQLFLVRRLANRVNQKLFIMCSLFSSSASILAFSLSHTILQIALSLLVYVLSMAFILAYYFTLVSNKVDNSMQGEIMGKLSSLQAIAAIIAMFFGGGINIFNYDYPLAASALAFLCSALLFSYIIHLDNTKNYSPNTREKNCG